MSTNTRFHTQLSFSPSFQRHFPALELENNALLAHFFGNSLFLDRNIALDGYIFEMIRLPGVVESVTPANAGVGSIL